MLINLIKSFFQSRKQTCIFLYNEAKRKNPGKTEKEYLKLILLTKPSFDYQLDVVIEILLEEYPAIVDLADFVDELSVDDYMWESRKRNIMEFKEKLNCRNKLYFTQFWTR